MPQTGRLLAHQLEDERPEHAAHREQVFKRFIKLGFPSFLVCNFVWLISRTIMPIQCSGMKNQLKECSCEGVSSMAYDGFRLFFTHIGMLALLLFLLTFQCATRDFRKFMTTARGTNGRVLSLVLPGGVNLSFHRDAIDSTAVEPPPVRPPGEGTTQEGAAVVASSKRISPEAPDNSTSTLGGNCTREVDQALGEGGRGKSGAESKSTVEVRERTDSADNRQRVGETSDSTTRQEGVDRNHTGVADAKPHARGGGAALSPFDRAAAWDGLWKREPASGIQVEEEEMNGASGGARGRTDTEHNTETGQSLSISSTVAFNRGSLSHTDAWSGLSSRGQISIRSKSALAGGAQLARHIARSASTPMPVLVQWFKLGVAYNVLLVVFSGVAGLRTSVPFTFFLIAMYRMCKTLSLKYQTRTVLELVVKPLRVFCFVATSEGVGVIILATLMQQFPHMTGDIILSFPLFVTVFEKIFVYGVGRVVTHWYEEEVAVLARLGVVAVESLRTGLLLAAASLPASRSPIEGPFFESLLLGVVLEIFVRNNVFGTILKKTVWRKSDDELRTVQSLFKCLYLSSKSDCQYVSWLMVLAINAQHWVPSTLMVACDLQPSKVFTPPLEFVLAGAVAEFVSEVGAGALYRFVLLPFRPAWAIPSYRVAPDGSTFVLVGYWLGLCSMAVINFAAAAEVLTAVPAHSEE